ncbi:hypothetical protein B5M09_012033 [Aphanomyces astaci]|uniref:Charged multivesicular body protein 6 n=1 Tax=Aphanomyces astaci TaxID=112090 RepID=A0A425CPF0_APHAT|nr:hypothetical protein B5M09_012033 [Aphanomyces astaci]
MGNLFGKKTEAAPTGPTARQTANRQRAQNQVSSKDKAVLELKASRDRLKKYQSHLEHESAQLTEKAKQLLEKKQRDRAKLCLQLRKFKQQQIEQADTHLMNVLQMVDSVEWETQQLQIFEGLKAGNSVLDAIHKEMTVEAVEDLMLDTQEAQARADEIGRLIGGSLTVDDDESILEELAAIEALEAEALDALLPVAPGTMCGLYCSSNKSRSARCGAAVVVQGAAVVVQGAAVVVQGAAVVVQGVLVGLWVGRTVVARVVVGVAGILVVVTGTLVVVATGVYVVVTGEEVRVTGEEVVVTGIVVVYPGVAVVVTGVAVVVSGVAVVVTGVDVVVTGVDVEVTGVAVVVSGVAVVVTGVEVMDTGVEVMVTGFVVG